MNKKNKFSIKKKEHEIFLYYELRKIFVDSFKPKNNKEFKLLEMYSNIFINILFLKCRYNTKTEKKIKDFMKKNIKLINFIKNNNLLIFK
jgi:hypothetical protein